MATENKIPEIIRSSMENIKQMVDTNTVIGDPILTNAGTTIIPISKISLGIATGGLDYNGKETTDAKNFGGGGGTGLSVHPVGFLVVSADGDVDFLNVGQKAKPDPIDQIADFVERTPDMIAKIKNIFAKEKAVEDDEEEAPVEAVEAPAEEAPVEDAAEAPADAE